MKTILAPVDFSPISDAVVDEASRLARATHGRVVLLAVIQPPVVMSEYAAMMDIVEITSAGEKHATRQLAKLEQRLKADGVTTETLHAVGSPIGHILEQAKKVGADYIVMGSHGHTAFYDLLVGSTTHGVLMRTTCPVVIVPAVKDKSATRRKKARRAA